jgi:hypothetical protein
MCCDKAVPVVTVKTTKRMSPDGDYVRIVGLRSRPRDLCYRAGRGGAYLASGVGATRNNNNNNNMLHQTAFLYTCESKSSYRSNGPPKSYFVLLQRILLEKQTPLRSASQEVSSLPTERSGCGSNR